MTDSAIAEPSIAAPLIHVLAVSGSLRAASVNTALLQVLAQLAPDSMRIRLFDGIAALPLFNPDLEGREPPPVHAWRAALASADAVIIASPEYAHGVTGAIKNALDWVVGSGELSGKPAAVLIASTRSEHAPAALARTVAVMDAQLIAAACLAVPVNTSRATRVDILALPAAVEALRTVLDLIADAVDAGDNLRDS